MVDPHYADVELAALYDAQCPWDRRGDFDFYLPWIMDAAAVLDVGCGTGMLLHGVRDRGHTGRLTGLDPGEGMLRVARTRADVEWVLGDLSTVSWEREFDVVVMTGHAFQVLVTDEELRVSLAAVRRALTDDGVFAFETRNPAARAWEDWTPDRVEEFPGPDGHPARCHHEVTAVDGDLVTFVGTYTSPAWDGPRHSESTLRFLDVPALDGFLAEAGLRADLRYGDWAGGPLTAAGPEIITLARRA
ncbi:MAG TPA: methyltransferase domain-containing protein [Pseudonocardiaceae bacterium]